NENGGPDNITVVIAHFEGEGLVPPTEGDIVGHSVFELQNATPATPLSPVRRITGKMRGVAVAEPGAAEPAAAPTGFRSGRWNQVLLLALAGALVVALLAFLYVRVRGAVSEDQAPTTTPADSARTNGE
ncbi:MAG TPA: hypothetical protein VFB46_07265, partial [Gemmatimonadaceae bacterium]|nr:hypothetical protein [Gemmatimonadaceae bacterium]